MNRSRKPHQVLILSFVVFLFSAQMVSAASLNLSADKTSLSTDDTVQIMLSVDGQIDDGQISFAGLDKFDIVGRSSSQSISIVNGQTTMVQKQIFSLRPNTLGQIKVFATAKSGGEKIKSQVINFQIKKSYLQSIKDNLLNDNGVNSENGNENKNQAIQEPSQNDTVTTPTDSAINQDSENTNIKKLLLAPQDNIQTNDDKQFAGNLNGKNFPKIQHISAFNSWFWLEVFGIVVLLLGIVFGINRLISNKAEK